jgi:uncharacterized protein YcbK (DUF882 family)
MKATTLTGSLVLLLVSSPSFASHGKEHKKKHTPSPTAMHTTHVHHRDESVTVAPPVVETTHKKDSAKRETKVAPKPCFHEPITIGRGTEEEKFSLTRCDGSATPEAVDHLSTLARPDSVRRWTGSGPLPQGMKRVDARLAERLQQVADHFAHGHPVAMHIVSGFRPNSVGSFHATAQAIDFRVDGIRNEELVAFCKTLSDTGCGYYPNSSFVHLDVRAPGTGHVTWIDASGPGEAAHYVTAWPPPPEYKGEDFAAKLARILPPIAVDEHPADVSERMIDAEATNGTSALRRLH